MNKLMQTRDIFSSTSISLDASKREISGTFSSEYPATRYGYVSDLPVDDTSILPNNYNFIEYKEILSHKSEHWNINRVKNGVCSLLNEHNRMNRLGKITNVSFDGKVGDFRAILNNSPDSELLSREIEENIQPGISFGYIVNKYEVISSQPLTLRATDIELIEISFTSIPLDPTVGLNKKAALNLSLRSITNENLGNNIMSEKSKIENQSIAEIDFDRCLNERAIAIENEYKSRESVIISYLKCRDYAGKLLSEAKISASEYEETFSNDVSKDIQELMSKGMDKANLEIGSISYWLDKSSKRSPILPIESKTSDSPSLPPIKDDSDRLRRFSESFSKNHKRNL